MQSIDLCGGGGQTVNEILSINVSGVHNGISFNLPNWICRWKMWKIHFRSLPACVSFPNHHHNLKHPQYTTMPLPLFLSPEGLIPCSPVSMQRCFAMAAFGSSGKEFEGVHFMSIDQLRYGFS
jgi:hypothetical protein